VSGLFLPCSCVCVCVCLLCVCESRFCVQVRSFNFDLCFRLFCVAFVDFCHLNRNFYFLHVSGHGQAELVLWFMVWFCIRAAVASFQHSVYFFLCSCAVFFFVFGLFLATFLCTHVLEGHCQRARVWQIGFLFSDIWKQTNGDQGPT